MEKIWLQEYPAGIPAEIDMQAFASLTDMLESSFRQYSQLPAFSNLDHTLSYAEVDQLSAAFAAFLQQKLGLQKGDRVAVMMPNLLQYPIALFGILRAGLTVVNVNPLYTPRELEHQLKDSGALAIVILENFTHILQQVVARTSVKHVMTTQIGDMLPLPKRLIVNLVVKYIKRMVPAWQLPGSIKFTQHFEPRARVKIAVPRVIPF